MTSRTASCFARIAVVAFALGATACGTPATSNSKANPDRSTPSVSSSPSSAGSSSASVCPTAHCPARVSGPSAPALPNPGVDLHSATAVALAEVEATWTLNTTTASGWYAGELAATAYMTRTYASSIRANPPVMSGDATWSTWAAHQATTSVAATVEPIAASDPGGPIDTATAAYAKIAATVTPTGADGWVGPSELWVTYVALARVNPGAIWQVTSTETVR